MMRTNCRTWRARLSIGPRPNRSKRKTPMIRIGELTLSIALGAMALPIHAASADDKLAGVWKLQSWVMENVETKETKAVFGERPNGYLILTREGRMIGLLTRSE